MKPQHVELIVAIAELGSLGAAAQRLNRTQPAITKALKTVESDIGTALFFRVSHGVVPTSAGEAVIDRCRRIYNDLQKLREEVAQIHRNFVGEVGVIVSPLAALKIIPPVVEGFHRTYPDIRIRISGGHPPDAFAPLRRGEFDFVLGPSAASEIAHGLKVEALFSSPVSIVTGAQSRYREETDAAVLSKGRWVTIGPKDRRPVYYEFFEARGLTPPDPVVKSDSILSILAMVENSDLLCSFPSRPLADIVSKWDIAVIPIKEEMPSVTFALTSVRNRLATPAALAFAEAVREHSRTIETDP